MTDSLRNHLLTVSCYVVIFTATARQVPAVEFSAVAEVLEDRCLSCHDSETRKGGIDLSPLTEPQHSSYGEHTELWIKLERKVRRGEMPPSKRRPLKPAEKDAIESWFHQSFVLRDGQRHIGPTPLRRLTRYEFERTLEDVLAIQLRTRHRDFVQPRLEASKITTIVPSDLPGDSGFDNDAHRMETLRPPLKELAQAVSFALKKFAESPEAQQAVLGRANVPKDASGSEVRELLETFASRAYRGQLQRAKSNTEVFFEIYKRHVNDTEDSRASFWRVLNMVLLSPEFLYRFETSQKRKTPYAVSGIELATRLSYFLWAAAPDDELLKLGRSGQLLKDEVLKAQVARMLSSPRRLSLSENFAGQWLGFDELLSNDEFLKSERWNRETYDEALFFFDELIKSDRSFLELVQSDWIYKRASELRKKRLGYEPIESDTAKSPYADVLTRKPTQGKKRRGRYNPPVLVRTKIDHEGGLITSAAILRLTASKDRTSPIRRGVWILEKIIGKELEVPPNVPSLDEARSALKLIERPTVAQVIEQHVSKPQCVSCHKEIDPLGLGLENP
ncbi:MAG: DUF1592 domain-containing protein [Planctomycetota bacterium]